VRRRVLRANGRLFVADDFAGSRQAVQRELSRLAGAGEIRKLRNGVYWRGKKTRLGITPPKAEEVVCKISGSTAGVGPASWSAALELGLSTQHPNKEFVAAPKRIKGNFPRIQIKDRSGRELRRAEHLNRVEVALLEVLEDWDRVVEAPPHAALGHLSKWIDSGAIRVNRVVKASATEPPVVREHLRELLQATGHQKEASQVKVSTVTGKLRPLALAG
jgi:Family of unknown function (DUF6088)